MPQNGSPSLSQVLLPRALDRELKKGNSNEGGHWRVALHQRLGDAVMEAPWPVLMQASAAPVARWEPTVRIRDLPESKRPWRGMGCARAIAEKGLSSSGVHKRSAPPGADFRVAYFSEVLIESKLVLSLEPTPCTAVMMAIAMPAAIRPYSIAVAPDSSRKNAKTKVFMMVPTPLLMIRTRGIPGAIVFLRGRI
jgi:hypothetical protein